MTKDSGKLDSKAPDPWGNAESWKGAGIWSEGNILDKLDKYLSGFLFFMDLGFVPECLLTVPGTWFGM